MPVNRCFSDCQHSVCIWCCPSYELYAGWENGGLSYAVIYWAFTIFPKWLGTAESMAVYLPAAALLFSAVICSLGMVYLLYGALSNLILTVICIAVLIMNIRMLKEDMVLELYLEDAFSPLADFAYHIWRMISMVVFFFPRLVPYYNLYANDKFNYLAFKLYGR